MKYGYKKTYAAREGFEKCTELLLGAEHSDETIAYPNLNGVTPLLIAVENGHTNVVRLILEKHRMVINSDIPPGVNQKK